MDGVLARDAVKTAEGGGGLLVIAVSGLANDAGAADDDVGA